MKAEDLKFPIVLKWFGEIYTIFETTEGKLDWTLISSTPRLYTASVGKWWIMEELGKGNATILAQPPQSTSTLKIQVDASEAVATLAAATTAAKELEFALASVKAMLQ